MPSGRAHDAVTLLLAVPAAAGTYFVTGNVSWSAALACSFLFGGLMFGPDLDTTSKQYSRWSIFKFIWLPYRVGLRHRSSWTHGLLTSTALRLIYFAGVVTLLSYLAALLVGAWTEARVESLLSFARAWRDLGGFTMRHLGIQVLICLLAGLWAGAAAHTITDLIVTYVRTGRLMRLI